MCVCIYIYIMHTIMYSTKHRMTTSSWVKLRKITSRTITLFSNILFFYVVFRLV